jgi:hypothetical protein
MSEAFPERLPQGERVLWEGRPHWQTLARRGLHLRKLAVYLAVLLVWYVATASTAEAPGDAALASLRMSGIAVTPLILICAYAWLSSRMTRYTITNRRVVMTIGIAMPITFNLPFTRIDAVNLKTWPGGAGDITLKLAATERLAYLVLWPHARPWRMARTEPALRCIPDAAQVSQIMARALAASANMPVQAATQATSGAGLNPAAALA